MNCLKAIKNFANCKINRQLIEHEKKEYTCKVCNENFEDKYFDKGQNKCILHCEKDDWYIVKNGNENWRLSEKKIDYFWHIIQEKYINVGKKNSRNETIFNQIIFPKHQKDYEYEVIEDEHGNSRDNMIDMGTNFCDYNYETNQIINVFSNAETKFSECIFLQDIDLSRYSIEKNISFINCTFKKSLFFSNPNIKKEIKAKIVFNNCDINKFFFQNIVFDDDVIFENKLNELQCNKSIFSNDFNIKNINKIESIDFFDSIFDKEFSINKVNYIDNLSLNESTFKNKVRIKEISLFKSDFYNVTFSDLADFYKTTFFTTNFNKTDFNDISVFTEATFKENVEFKYTTFNKLSIFRNTVFKKEVDLTDSIFNVKGNFLGISSNKDKYQDIKVSNRETARIIKDSFEQQNNIIEANKFYALEMKEMEKELKFTKRPFEWLVFKTHSLASNHSQEWLLVLFWIINLTFITTYLSHELFCENIIKHIDRGFTFFGGLVTLGVVFSKFNEFYRNIAIIISTICIYLFYSNSYVNDSNLKEFSNMINPFSIMTKGEELSFGTLIYKIIIAYLIYQLIVSIRQNTRRK
ncbi:pentapeptide repeat-containing protein [Halarcobacter sp.]|uniref:pentapeptide repeat-containing protein n=1 Tax=Halarcobacter sp. TaxID=2321133 RepID=UPI003A8F2DB1